MDSIFDSLAQNALIWLPEHGMGYYPVPDDSAYDAGYFAKYQGYAATAQGMRITAARVDLVNRFTTGRVIDIGIGCGSFVEVRGMQTGGYDIMAPAVEWLQERGAWVNPYECESVESLSFWDSLEHLHEPDVILSKIRRFAFMSLPIFTGCQHILRSKHFRKDEHRWYFTESGLIKYMGRLGFEARSVCRMEEKLGREDIGTFVFEKVDK
jgi:hypothetical protein